MGFADPACAASERVNSQLGSKEFQQVEDVDTLPSDQAENAVSVSLSYTGDLWSARRGGVAQGERYLHSIDARLNANLEPLVGLKATTLLISVNHTNGASISRLIGDAQFASSLESGTKRVGLYEAWIDKGIGRSASVRAGIYNLNSEFDVLETSGLFVGSAHGIGSDIGQTGENGPSIFPTPGLGIRLSAKFKSGWTLRAAALEGVPGDPNHPKRLAIRLGKREGALLIGEVEAPLLQGKLLAGMWHYTSRFDTNSGRRERGNLGVYLRGETKVFRERSDPDLGLSAFFRMGTASGKFNQFSRFLSGGLTYSGAVPGRRKDQLGLAFAHARTSPSYRRASGGQRAETNFELTYKFNIKDKASLQPFAQYFINPGTNPALKNARAFGVRLSFGIG